MKFKVGDQVVGNAGADIYGITSSGWMGEVVEVGVGGFNGYISVRALPGYRGGSTTFPVESDHFDLISRSKPHKIVVATDGVKTVARLYDGKRVIRSAEAKCSPKDEFNFETGAALAVDRLLGREVQKPAEPKLFPLGDIKAGYLIRVRGKDGQTYNMTVIPGGHDGALGCSSRRDWWSLSQFGDELDYEGRQIIEVYGYTCNMGLLENNTRDRSLLWSREI